MTQEIAEDIYEGVGSGNRKLLEKVHSKFLEEDEREKARYFIAMNGTPINRCDALSVEFLAGRLRRVGYWYRFLVPHCKTVDSYVGLLEAAREDILGAVPLPLLGLPMALMAEVAAAKADAIKRARETATPAKSTLAQALGQWMITEGFGRGDRGLASEKLGRIDVGEISRLRGGISPLKCGRETVFNVASLIRHTIADSDPVFKQLQSTPRPKGTKKSPPKKTKNPSR